ncbi:MAG: ribonuclease HII [Deltaproteobacteria bacterium]|nr:ribonuclease HII [Deltaproteobacteria bacterium]
MLAENCEKEYYGKGFQYVAGVDEVGRGCLAGPVIAAAVILPMDHELQGLSDSKLLSENQREKLSQEIHQRAIAIGIGSMGPEVIDRINILQASCEAMRKAILQLQPPPDFLLVDGNLKNLLSIPQKSIPQGDRRCQSIAAASIVAKVFRDNLMKTLDAQYPQYDWATNKGYPTTTHLVAIEKFGVSELHRKTFRGVKEWISGRSPQLEGS